MPHLASLPAAPATFRCDVVPERDRVRVAPAGELDLATAPQLEQAIRELLDAGFEHVIVDLTELDFLDASGLRALLRLQASSADGAFQFELKPGPPSVQRIFELSGTTDVFIFLAPLKRMYSAR
jgi:anti-sigma B factor antagonist